MMKKLLFFTLSIALFTSCSNVGQYADAINALSGDWDSTTKLVTDLAGKVTGASDQWNTMSAAMQITDELKDKLGADQLETLTNLVGGNSAITSAFGNLSGDVAGFISNWSSKGELLTGLTEGLAAGKLPDNAQGTIDELTGLIGQGKEKVTGWETALEAVTGQGKSAFDQFQSIVSAVAGN